MLEVLKTLGQLGTSSMPAGWAVLMGISVLVAYVVLR